MSKLITKPKDIRLREENETQVILGRPPGWLTRWGIMLVLAGTVLLLLLGTWLRYPDIVEAPAKLITEDPPVKVEAKADGRIAVLEYRTGDQVQAGDLLGIIQNPVDASAVAEVREKLLLLNEAVAQKAIIGFQLPGNIDLGSLQELYAELGALLSAHQYLIMQDDKQRLIALARQQIRELKGLDTVIQKEINTLKEEVNVAQGKVERYESRVPKVVSALELEEAKTTYLKTRRELESKERDLITNRLESKKLESQILELQQQENDEISQGWLELTAAIQKMQSALDIWQDTYLLEAPIAGRVILSKFWHINQFVRSGEAVLTIDPGETTQPIIARAELPLHRSGKVNPGDTVLLRLDDYPYKEYGVVKGTVSSITPLPETAETGQLPVYFAEIGLTQAGLVSTARNRRPMEFTQEMRATARIITEDRSFLGRVMDELTSIFEKN